MGNGSKFGVDSVLVEDNASTASACSLSALAFSSDS